MPRAGAPERIRFTQEVYSTANILFSAIEKKFSQNPDRITPYEVDLSIEILPMIYPRDALYDLS